MARLWLSPADMALTLSIILTGLERLVVVPSPSCPLLFMPIAQRVPSFLSMRTWKSPALTSRNFPAVCAWREGMASSAISREMSCLFIISVVLSFQESWKKGKSGRAYKPGYVVAWATDCHLSRTAVAHSLELPTLRHGTGRPRVAGILGIATRGLHGRRSRLRRR